MVPDCLICDVKPAAILWLWLETAARFVGNAQHATATTQRGMRPRVLLGVSPTLSTHGARRG